MYCAESLLIRLAIYLISGLYCFKGKEGIEVRKGKEEGSGSLSFFYSNLYTALITIVISINITIAR